MSAIVTDYRVLKAMERRGFIETRDGSAIHWSGVRVRNYFVAPGPKLYERFQAFTYKKQEYRLQYFDGCFHPFVTKVGAPLPAFV